jgi:hypothetical protein
MKRCICGLVIASKSIKLSRVNEDRERDSSTCVAKNSPWMDSGEINFAKNKLEVSNYATLCRRVYERGVRGLCPGAYGGAK